MRHPDQSEKMCDPVAEPNSPAPSRPYRKAIILLLVGLVVAGGWAGYRSAKFHLSIERARREIARKDFNQAEFWGEQAMSVMPGNPDAARVMAEINEAQDMPLSLLWRTRVAQLAPESDSDLMAWAKCAFRFEHDQMARKVLERLSDSFKETSADYWELMAGCALKERIPAAAEACFAKAVAIDPGNATHKVNLAAYRLTFNPSPEVQAEAERQLNELSKDRDVGIFALRTLFDRAVFTGNKAEAVRLADRLLALPKHDFSDSLRSLRVALEGPGFDSQLQKTEREAEKNPGSITEMGDWLNAHSRAQETDRWYARLPERDRMNIRVQMTESQALLNLRDWKKLEAFLKGCHWVEGDFIRDAMIIRCHYELSLPWEKEWRDLLARVASTPPEGLMLARLVIGWNWGREAIGLLWGATARPETEMEALHFLWEIYQAINDTPDLLRVAREQLKLDPSNPERKNNVAFLSLLVEGASAKTLQMASEAYQANPKVPTRAATYAYALHLAKKDPEAQKIMQNLAPEAVHLPGIALYQALILDSTGQPDAARETLLKLNAQGMLVEERKLARDLAQKLKILDH